MILSFYILYNIYHLIMETCVLIPKEFSLALANDRDKSNVGLFIEKNDSNHIFGSNVRISVWSNVFIPRGTLIYPFQGSIRFDKIDLYSLLDDNDVSYYEKIIYFSDYAIA